MSRYNAIPAVHARVHHEEPKLHQITSLPCDDFAAQIPSRSYDLHANLRALSEYFESEEAVDDLVTEIRPRDASTIFASNAGPRANRVSAGELRFRKVMRICDEVMAAQPPREEGGIYLHPAQRRGVRADLIACAPFFYGTDWSANEERFRRQYGLKRHYRWRFDIKPRRHGMCTSYPLRLSILKGACCDCMYILGSTSRLVQRQKAKRYVVYACSFPCFLSFSVAGTYRHR